MRLTIVSFLLLICSSRGASQSLIRGYLIDSVDRSPIEFATVYFNGTSTGTVSDERGYFELKASRFPQSLVLSHLSYQSELEYFESAPRDTLRIALRARALNLSSVQVVDKDKRQRNVQEFIANFIGLDTFGRSSSLQNPEVLQFERTYEERPLRTGLRIVDGLETKRTVRRAKDFFVEARAPLIVKQDQLGYKIRVDLVTFQLNYGSGLGQGASNFWQGYYFFEPYQNVGKGKQKRFLKNRMRAYYESPQHFLKAVFDQNLAVQGYQVFERVRDEKTRQIRYEAFDLQAYLSYTDKGDLVLKGLQEKRLEILYYGDGRGHPKDVTKRAKGLPSQSLIQILDNQCLIRSDGTTPGFSLRFGGTMAEKKVGAMLPADYQLPSK